MKAKVGDDQRFDLSPGPAAIKPPRPDQVQGTPLNMTGPTKKRIRTMPAAKVDKAWFEDRLKEVGLSQRQLAKLMDRQNSAISLIFDGKRKLWPQEVPILARHLNVSTEDVLRHLDADVRGTLATPIPVQGWVDKDGLVHWEKPKLGSGTVDAPPGVPNDAIALRVQGGVMDGWLLYLKKAEDVSMDALGRLCLVTVKSPNFEYAEPFHAVGWVRRGYEAGFWNLGGWGERTEEKEVRLLAASPILWIKQ